jgi:hypothetical protein
MKLSSEWRRILIATALFCVGLGLWFVYSFEVNHYGPGLFPTLCLITSFFSIVAGCGILFRRVGDFLLYALGVLMKVFEFFS